MMNRRDFLKHLFAAGAVVAAKPFIFDMGANLWKKPEPVVGFPRMFWRNTEIHVASPITVEMLNRVMARAEAQIKLPRPSYIEYSPSFF